MGGGASVKLTLDSETPWEHGQDFINDMKRDIAGTNPVTLRKLEFQKQVRLVGKTVKHLKIIRTMQATMAKQKKADAKSADVAKTPKLEESSANALANLLTNSQNKSKSDEDKKEEGDINLDPLQQMLLDEMKATGVEVEGRMAEDIQRAEEEKQKRVAEGKAKKKRKKVKTRQSLVNIQIRLATCNTEPFDQIDADEFDLALKDLDGNDTAQLKSMLENFGFPTPTPSRENLRLMDFPFVHGCIIGIVDKSGYHMDLLLEKERDELKFEGRRDEEKFLLKFATAAAHDLGTIDPSISYGPNSPKGTDLLPNIDIYHVCVGDLRKDVKPEIEMVEDKDAELMGTHKEKVKKVKPSGLYLSRQEFYKRYGSDKRYNYLKPVDDPSVARLYLQYLCLAAGEVTKSRKRMHAPRRTFPEDGDMCTQAEFLYRLGEEEGEKAWEYAHPNLEKERAIKAEQERQRRERALQLRKEQLAAQKVALQQRLQHRCGLFEHRLRSGHGEPCGCQYCLHNDIYNDSPGQFIGGKLMTRATKITKFNDHIMKSPQVFVPGAVDLLHAGVAADSLSVDFLY